MKLITPEEASQRLGHLPIQTLAQWRYLRKGPRYVKVGRHVRYDVDDIDAWVAANKLGGDAR